jgi:predicted GNAT superfamily acetyltransferase
VQLTATGIEPVENGAGHVAHGSDSVAVPSTGTQPGARGPRADRAEGPEDRAPDPRRCRTAAGDAEHPSATVRPDLQEDGVTADTARQRATATATRAATAAGVALADLHDHAASIAVSGLFDEVWGRDPAAGPIMDPAALTALAHAGGQVSGAFRDRRLVGATAAFLGRSPQGEVFLHSHVTGVVAGSEGRGVGRALKWHQRAWALERDITRVRWTFDPLIRRNAVFNLMVLGARAVEYSEDVYGRMRDARNAGAPSDRLVADWELSAPRVDAAADGRAAAPDLAALRRSGAEPVLTVTSSGGPALSPYDAPRRLVQIPADIEQVRSSDPELASRWAEAVRASLGGALHDGLRVTGITRDGWYVLAADRSVAELAGRR